MNEITIPSIVGSKIVEIRKMTREEMETESWDTYHENPMVIVLDSGIFIYPMSDPEGNGPGCIVGSVDVQDVERTTFYIEPEKA